MSINENGTNRVDRDVASDANRLIQKNGLRSAEEVLILTRHFNNDEYQGRVILAYEKLANDRINKALGNIVQELSLEVKEYFSTGIPTLDNFQNADDVAKVVHATVTKYVGHCSESMMALVYTEAMKALHQWGVENVTVTATEAIPDFPIIEEIQANENEQVIKFAEQSVTVAEPTVVKSPVIIKVLNKAEGKKMEKVAQMSDIELKMKNKMQSKIVDLMVETSLELFKEMFPSEKVLAMREEGIFENMIAARAMFSEKFSEGIAEGGNISKEIEVKVAEKVTDEMMKYFETILPKKNKIGRASCRERV